MSYWPPQPLPDDDDPLTDAELWRARYLAAHEVLVHVEAFCEAGIPDPQQASGVDFSLYRSMRDAFHAYRMALECAAPLAWVSVEVDA